MQSVPLRFNYCLFVIRYGCMNSNYTALARGNHVVVRKIRKYVGHVSVAETKIQRRAGDERYQ